MDIITTLEYPWQHIAGLDVAGELFGLGLWGEAALFFPDTLVVTDMTAVGGERTEKQQDIYLKGVVGFDYTFTNGMYVNLQYAHGLAYENSREELEHYLMLGFEWKVFDGLLKNRSHRFCLRGG